MMASYEAEESGGAAAAQLLRKSEALRAKLQEQREEGGRLAGERESLRGEFMVATRRLHCMRGEECATSVGVHDLRAEVALLKGQIHEAERSVAALRAARDEHAARAGSVRRRIEEGEQQMSAARSAEAAFWEAKAPDVRALRAGISEMHSEMAKYDIETLRAKIAAADARYHQACIDRDRLRERCTNMAAANGELEAERTRLMNEILAGRAGLTSALGNARTALERIAMRELEAETELQRRTSACKGIEKRIDVASAKILANKAQLYETPFGR